MILLCLFGNAGARYEVGPADLEPKLAVLHVRGTAYEMGQAYGSLMRDEIRKLLPEAFAYLRSEIGQYLQWLPKKLREEIETFGIEAGLNLTISVTKPHTPQHFLDTLNGLANGTGMPMHELYQISMIPELIKASCSIVGAWDDATADKEGLLQLRALDWTTSGPFQQFPLLLNYHPTDGGHDFSILTWAGLVGAITGFSSAGMGVSEKVWIEYSGVQNIVGYPFHFLMQDILQFDQDMDQALSRVATANRTCSIFLGIGDKTNDYFKLLEYSYQEVNIYNDKNFPTYRNHDQFDSLVFVDKHVQPSKDPCLNSLMHKYYGSLSPQTLIDTVSLFQTGDMHVAIYDYERSLMFVSNASPMNGSEGSVIPAYDRQFIGLDMTQMWNASLAASPQ